MFKIHMIANTHDFICNLSIGSEKQNVEFVEHNALHVEHNLRGNLLIVSF